MSKSKLTLKIDADVKELAKEKYNVSQEVEKHLSELIKGPDSIEERIEEINDEIKERKDLINEEQKRISNLQNEKKTLEKQLDQQAKATDEKLKFLRIAQKHIGDSWNQPSDIPVYWKSKFDEDEDELWDLAQRKDVDPIKPTKH